MSEKSKRVTIIKLCNSYGDTLRFRSKSEGYSDEQLSIIEAVLSGQVDDYDIEEVGEEEKHTHINIYILKNTPCPTCGGSGRDGYMHYDKEIDMPCCACGGTGETGDSTCAAQCKTCHGTGKEK